MKKPRKSLKLKKKKDFHNPILQIDDDKITKIRNIVASDITYDKIKYKSNIYSIGECLLVRDVNEGFLVAKLIKVIQYNGFKKYPFWPTIQVQWYYKKSDINREKNGLKEDRLFESISDFEVFKSNHTDIIFIESLISPCKIYTYEEYEKIDEHTNTTFFCRASYDPIRESLIPCFDTWEKACLCKKPLNPDQLYIKCDKCDGWFHPKCCNIPDNDIDRISEFYCDDCKIHKN